MRLTGQRSSLVPLFIALLLVFEIASVNAQELEPRAYTNIPVGINFMLAGYNYSAGGVLFDPTVPLENANFKIHGVLIAYARSVKIGGMSGKVDMILPYGWLSGTADFQGQPVSREISGLADPRIRMSVNFVGSPALTLSEFKDYRQDLVVGACLQVYLPMGQYDPDRLVNIGTNRFTFKPELGISKTLGSLVLEFTAGAAFYTVNHEFYQDKTRSQAPIGSLQGHFCYTFRRGIWAALDGTYYWGGHTTTDGVEGDDLQSNTRLGLTFSLPMNFHNSLRLLASTGVSTRTGTDFNTVSIVWQYRWGKELPK